MGIDVKNAPDREDDDGFPRKHRRETIGNALRISDEWVRRLEEVLTRWGANCWRSYPSIG